MKEKIKKRHTELNKNFNLRNYFTISLSSTNNFTFSICTTPAFAMLFTTNVSFTDSSFPLNLFCRNTALSRCYSVNNLNPNLKWSSGLVKYRVGKWVNLIATMVTFIARSIYKFAVFSYFIANRTINAIWVPVILNPFKTSIVVRKILRQNL